MALHESPWDLLFSLSDMSWLTLCARPSTSTPACPSGLCRASHMWFIYLTSSCSVGTDFLAHIQVLSAGFSPAGGRQVTVCVHTLMGVLQNCRHPPQKSFLLPPAWILDSQSTHSLHPYTDCLLRSLFGASALG